MAAQIPPDEVEMAQSHAPEAGKASSIAKVLSPKPAETDHFAFTYGLP